MFPHGLGHNTPKVSGAWAEAESFRTNFSRSRLSFMSNSHESCWLAQFEVGIFPGLENEGDLSKLQSMRHFDNWRDTFFKPEQFADFKASETYRFWIEHFFQTNILDPFKLGSY